MWTGRTKDGWVAGDAGGIAAPTPGPVSDVAAMRAFLAALGPRSGAESLQALRGAFPRATLAARVAALACVGVEV